MDDIAAQLAGVKAGLHILNGTVYAIKETFITIVEFIKDPFATAKAIADPLFLVLMASLILLKFFGFKGLDKYMKLTFIIYIIILIF